MIKYLFAAIALLTLACRSTGSVKGNLPGDSALAQQPAAVSRHILNPYEAAAFHAHMNSEHQKFGRAHHQKLHKTKKYGKSVVEQRSGRKRLYDHNIFLRALFADRLKLNDGHSLRKDFEGGIFFDIGSAILSGEGADTVRDLHEDPAIQPRLTLIASDINDPSSKQTMYVDIYRQQGSPLPFAVVEIPMLMVKPEHFINPIAPYLTADAGIILRSANSGPDLYYDEKQVRSHLQAALQAFAGRPVLYFFNKYILYKPKKAATFFILAEVDSEVAINHKKPVWEQIDWSKRTFQEAITLNPSYLYSAEQVL
jgi:hypothetical protein